MDSEDENTPPDDLQPRQSQKPTPAPFFHAPFKPSVPEVSLLFNNAPLNASTSNVPTTFRNNTKSSENHSADEFESYNAWKYKNLNSSHKSNLSPDESSPTFKYYSPPQNNPTNNRLTEQGAVNPVRNSPEFGHYHRNDGCRDDFSHHPSPFMAPLQPHGYQNPQNSYPVDTYSSPSRRYPNNSPVPNHEPVFPQRNFDSMSSQRQNDIQRFTANERGQRPNDVHRFTANELSQRPNDIQRFTANELIQRPNEIQRFPTNERGGRTNEPLRFTSNELAQRQMANEQNPVQRYAHNELIPNQRHDLPFTANDLMQQSLQDPIQNRSYTSNLMHNQRYPYNEPPNQRQFMPNDLLQNHHFTSNDLMPRNSIGYSQQRQSVNDYDTDRRYNQFDAPNMFSSVKNSQEEMHDYRQRYERDDSRLEEMRLMNQTSPQRRSYSNLPAAYENLMRNQPNSYQNVPDPNRITNFISSIHDSLSSATEERYPREKPVQSSRKSPNSATSRNRKTTANAVVDLCRIVQLQNEQLQVLQSQVALLLNNQLKRDNVHAGYAYSEPGSDIERRNPREVRSPRLASNPNVNQLHEPSPSDKNLRAAAANNTNELPTRDDAPASSVAWDKSVNFSAAEHSAGGEHPNNYAGAIVQKVSIGVMTSYDLGARHNDFEACAGGARPKNKSQLQQRGTQTGAEACHNDLRRRALGYEENDARRRDDRREDDGVQANQLHRGNEAKSSVNALRHSEAAGKSNLGNSRELRSQPTSRVNQEDVSRLAESCPDESLSLHASAMSTPAEHAPTPDSSVNVDMPDYRSSDDDAPDSPAEPSQAGAAGGDADSGRVGWTFYNNVVGQVNQILESNPPQSTGNTGGAQWKDGGRFGARCPATITGGGKEAARMATVEQLRRLGVTLCDQEENNASAAAAAHKKMTLDSLYYNGPRLDFMRLNNAAEAVDASDISAGMNALALKYLKDDQVNEYARLSTAAGNNMQDVTVYNIATKTTNLSFATMRYLERYQLLPPRSEQPLQQLPPAMEPTNLARQEPRSPIREELNQGSQPSSEASGGNNSANLHQEQRPPTKILDITALKQQPKFI